MNCILLSQHITYFDKPFEAEDRERARKDSIRVRSKEKTSGGSERRFISQGEK
jgi:hypothetical protein